MFLAPVGGHVGDQGKGPVEDVQRQEWRGGAQGCWRRPLSVQLISDESTREIDSARVTKEYFLCPFEIDWLSCLAITNLVVDGSLSLDVERKKAQDRWRTLMRMNLATDGAS